MPIKRKYINTNPYKPTKRSDSYIKKNHFKIGANVSRKIGSIGTRDHFEIYYLKISSIVPVMSVEMHQEEKEREREKATFRRRSVVLHFSFLPEENAFAALQPSVWAFIMRHTRGLFSRDHVQLLTEHTSTRERVREKGGCVKGLIDRSH